MESPSVETPDLSYRKLTIMNIPYDEDRNGDFRSKIPLQGIFRNMEAKT